MTLDLLQFLNKYTFDTFWINRLIVSTFVSCNEIKVPCGSLISPYIIKKTDRDYEKLVSFEHLVKKKYTTIDFEVLLELFEFVISPQDKIVNGAVYTPKYIRTIIIDECFNKIPNELMDKVAVGDISCGCGGFLLDAAIKIKNLTGKSFRKIFKENLFGLDIQGYSIERTKIILTLYALVNKENITKLDFNLFTGNALDYDWSRKDIIKKKSGFDIILGNPPYVCSRNIDDISKKLISKWEVATTGHPDLYIPFFQIGFELLIPGGILAYITVNSFIKSLNGRALRNYFQRHSISLKIIDFGGEQVFQSRLTYTCICFLENTYSESIKYRKDTSRCVSLNNDNFSEISYRDLDFFSGWNLNNNSIINKIENTGCPLGNLYTIKSGIATLKNDIYIFKPTREDKNYYYISDDYPIERAICKDIINPNRLINESELDKIKKKIIFPYVYNNGKAYLLKEKEFHELYPFAYKYLQKHRSDLATRDKGKNDYEKWYAYGRNQSLERYTNKLFFPHISPRTPNFVLCQDDDLLFVNGIAAVSNCLEELQVLKTLLETRLFWFYILNTSKNYSSGYLSLSRNYIKSFGIYNFSPREREFLKSCKDKEQINQFIEDKYDVKYPIDT